jgi:hypothetical protein
MPKSPSLLATGSKIVSDGGLPQLLPNPALISNPVIAGVCDVSVNTMNTFSGSGHSVCSIWVQMCVVEGGEVIGVSV